MARVVLSILLAGVVIAGCETSASTPSTAAVVSDSSGVRVIEHAEGDAAAFGRGTSALLEVGRDETTELPLYRVAGGMLASDGSFVIADAGNCRLVRWSAAGERMASVGRRGDGPGEFESIGWIHATPDGAAVYDSRSRRVSWFDVTGGFLRSIQFEVSQPDPPSDDAIVAAGIVLGVVGPGQTVAYAMAHADPRGEEGPLPLYGDMMVYDLANTAVASLGRFMLLEWYEDPSNEGFPLGNRMETPRLHWHGRDDLLVIADPVAHRVDVLQAGTRKAVILEARARLVFTPDSIPSEYTAAADSLQAYRDVRIDRERRIWVKPAVVEGQLVTRWRVFSQHGDRLGDLELPTDATVLDASTTVLLLLRRSDLDEEYVELWDLAGPAL